MGDTLDVYRQIAAEAGRRLSARKGLVTPGVVWEVVGDMAVVLMDKLQAAGLPFDHDMMTWIAECLTEQMCVESARVEPLRPDWLSFNQGHIEAVKDHGMILMPLRGIAIRKKPEGLLLRVAELPSYLGSRTQILNTRVWSHLGYREEAVDGAVMQADAFVEFLKRQNEVVGDAYTSPVLLHRMRMAAAFAGVREAAAKA